MTPPCHWCGGSRGVRPVLRRGMAVRSPIPGQPLHLCPRCWGAYRETGQRAGIGGRPPGPGPVTGMPLTPDRLRLLGDRR